MLLQGICPRPGWWDKQIFVGDLDQIQGEFSDVWRAEESEGMIWIMINP